MTAILPPAATEARRVFVPRRRRSAALRAARRIGRFVGFDLARREASESAPVYPPAPEGEVLYAIGDIHGRADLLADAMARIDADRERADRAPKETEIYLGDYIDRGPDSKTVVEMMVARAKSARVVALRGNHETLMAAHLAGRLPFAAWRALGGVETLLSYGLDPAALRHPDGPRPEALAGRLPAEHRRFLAQLRPLHVVGGYCFVHAGLRPGVALDQQADADLVGIREPFLGHRSDHGFIVVHGHTPVAAVEFKRNRINIDTGAYLSNRLSVVRIGAAGACLLEAGAP
jgi:serine/threonine protein phosphatase 1